MINCVSKRKSAPGCCSWLAQLLIAMKMPAMPASMSTYSYAKVPILFSLGKPHSLQVWLLQLWCSHEPMALLFKPTKWCSLQFPVLGWSALKPFPSPRSVHAHVLGNLSKLTWILKLFRKTEIFGIQLIQSFHWGISSVVKFQISPFFKKGAPQTVSYPSVLPPKPSVLLSQMEWQECRVQGEDFVSVCLNTNNLTFTNAQYWICFSHCHKKKIRQEILLPAVQYANTFALVVLILVGTLTIQESGSICPLNIKDKVLHWRCGLIPVILTYKRAWGEV